jgi:hypothetical protein
MQKVNCSALLANWLLFETLSGRTRYFPELLFSSFISSQYSLVVSIILAPVQTVIAKQIAEHLANQLEFISKRWLIIKSAFSRVIVLARFARYNLLLKIFIAHCFAAILTADFCDKSIFCWILSIARIVVHITPSIIYGFISLFLNRIHFSTIFCIIFSGIIFLINQRQQKPKTCAGMTRKSTKKKSPV